MLNVHLLFSTILVASLGGGVGQSNNIRCLERERRALLMFKDELFDRHNRLSSWGVGKYQRDCCKWRGVRCHNRTHHVTQLNLRGPTVMHDNHYRISIAPLHGKISSSLIELKHLTYLDLSYNDFQISNIPEFIGSFEKLQYLNLSNTNYDGSIPPSVGNLSKLMYLDFGGNDFLSSDNLDWVSHLGSLKYLDLRDVRLDKASNWLQAISKLTIIEELHLQNCDFQEIRPSSLPFINSSAPLAVLDLSHNHDFSSSMFQWFLNFSKSLTFIDVSSTNIKGLISAYSFDDQISLAHLDLSSNKLGGGSPNSIGNMSNLVYLNLHDNQLIAQLSELMMNFSEHLEKKLQYLDLSHNMISGSIAKAFLPYQIHYLDMSSNNFIGEIPDLTNYPFLKRLNLNNNMLNGNLKESIGCMSMMEHLVLGSNNLQGTITESHFFNLSRLQTLDLSSNSLLKVNFSTHWVPPFQLIDISLSGCNIGPSFPSWLQFQRKLEYIDISSCQIAGTIPNQFGEFFSRLIYLNASNNDIHGILPESFFMFTNSYQFSRPTSILDLSRNKITGQVTFLCQNVSWMLIDLSDNLFFGHLPNCSPNFTHSDLFSLNLANNHFVGEIPKSFGSCRSLNSLNLRNNSLSGEIPASMRNCENLVLIDLGENMLTGNIPTWIGDVLSSLIVLSLNKNEFHGMIPSSICSLQNIQVLDLSANMISGPIPKCFYKLISMTKLKSDVGLFYVTYPHGEISRNLEYDSLRDGAHIMWKGKEVNYVKGLLLVKLIDLSDNLLVGDIPSEITELDGLVMLNLSRNNLSGQIPRNIGFLKDLETLDLSRNHLSGSIPLSISELSSLGALDLSCNNLSGRIPPQYTRFDESSYAGNSGLCGRPVLNRSCPGDDKINRQDPNFNNWENEEDKFITKGFYICMTFGFIIGFWGIFGTILLSKSARFAYFKLLNTIEDFVRMKVELSKARFRSRIQN